MKNDDRIKKIKTLQTRVLETILSQEELDSLMKKYADNSGHTGVFQRRRFLKKPIAPSEKNTLTQYLQFDSQRKLTEALGEKASRDKVARIGLRWIFQNKEILDEALKGGELNDK